MRYLPPLKALQAFEAAARHGSIKLAADELNVTASAITHQIKLIEGHLGIQLFYRALTGIGRNYLLLVGGALDRIEDATRKIVEDGYTDILTVHCSLSFAMAWLMPRLPSFRAENPGIEIRLRVSPEPWEFLRGDVDVEIRSGGGDWPGLYVTQLMTEQVTPMFSPRLADQLSKPPDLGDLCNLTLLHSERSTFGWEAWVQANRIEGINVSRGPRFDHAYLAVRAAVDGWGVALESTIFGERELASGELVAPFSSRSVSTGASRHHFVCPHRFLVIPKVRVFHDWTCREAAARGGPAAPDNSV